MSVKLFFQTHGRFPTTDEFRLIRTFRQHQPEILNDDVAPHRSKFFQFVHAARHGDLERLKALRTDILKYASQWNNLSRDEQVKQVNAHHSRTAKNIQVDATTAPPACCFDMTPTIYQSLVNMGLIPRQQYDEDVSPDPNTNTQDTQRAANTPTALSAAAQGDHVDILAYLLDNNASVDHRPPHNRTALLFASESGHFNSMNFLISRGATYFTYSDQQIESYYMSYTIRQSITRRELSYILPGDLLPGIVLDYLGLGGHRTRPIERLAPVNIHNKTSFGAKPIPDVILAPIPIPHPCPIDLTNQPIETFTPEEWELELKSLQEEKQLQQRAKMAEKKTYVESKYPQGFNSSNGAVTSTSTTNQNVVPNNIADVGQQPAAFQ